MKFKQSLIIGLVAFSTFLAPHISQAAVQGHSLASQSEITAVLKEELKNIPTPDSILYSKGFAAMKEEFNPSKEMRYFLRNGDSLKDNSIEFNPESVKVFNTPKNLFEKFEKINQNKLLRQDHVVIKNNNKI